MSIAEAGVEAAVRPRLESGVISVAFVGALAQPNDGPDNPAHSAAGTALQENLLRGLADGGADVSAVFSLRPVPSFPAVRRLWFGGGEVTVADRFAARLLPFINLGPLKIASSGVAVFLGLMRWAWTQRGRRRGILTYNVSAPPGIAAVLAGRLTATPVFAVVADIQVPGSGFVPDSVLRRLDFRLQTRTLSLCDGLVVLTQRMASDFAPHTPVLLVEGGVAPQALERELPRPSASGRPTVFAYAGSMTELKGAGLLADAVEHITVRDIEIWFIGTGPLDGRIRELARRDARVRFFGAQRHDRVLELYREVDVLLNPHSTTHESVRYLFPSKLLEYLATGRPVITTCSTPEVRTEYGDVVFLVEQDGPSGLAAVIDYVAGLSAEERAAVGTRGRARVAAQKTWPRQAGRILDFMMQTGSHPA